MAQKTIKGSATIAKQIKARRNELGLTIEEAALRAGVGTKTWSRYEAGESIRKDKCKGICKALSWHTFPSLEEEKEEGFSMQEYYKEHEAWSEFLENAFGERAAMAFATGSDILLDYIGEDMTELASLPVKSHLGQLNTSWLCSDLPEQFLMHYDYDFLYQLKCTLYKLRAQAKNNVPMEAHRLNLVAAMKTMFMQKTGCLICLAIWILLVVYILIFTWMLIIHIIFAIGTISNFTPKQTRECIIMKIYK